MEKATWFLAGVIVHFWVSIMVQTYVKECAERRKAQK